MDRGHIKLYRKSIDSFVFKDDVLWKIWCYCLLTATRKPIWVTARVGRGTVQLNLHEGELVWKGRRSAEKLGYPYSTCMRKLEVLEKEEEMIKIKRDGGVTIIKIINWFLYQGDRNNMPNSFLERNNCYKIDEEDLQRIKSQFNLAVAGSNIPQIKTILPGTQIYSDLGDRLQEDDFRLNIDEIMHNIALSHYLRNEAHWFTFDWLVKSRDNYTRVHNGNYNRKNKINNHNNYNFDDLDRK